MTRQTLHSSGEGAHPGKGFIPVLLIVIRMAEDARTLVISALENAVKELVCSLDAGLIPETGTNIAYALPGARDQDEVAAVEGRIVQCFGRPEPSGTVKFGASEHVARIVLTAMKFDPDIRSAANIRYTPGIIGIIENLLLETCSFERGSEPPGTRTMDWGVAFCCRSGVPDVIFDRGAPGKEPVVRILGEEPAEVVAIIARISQRFRRTPE